MTDIMEILVAWDAGEGNTAIAERLGYSRPTARKYTDAARRARAGAGWGAAQRGGVGRADAGRHGPRGDPAGTRLLNVK